MSTPLDQALLQHGQFVQVLARELLRDAHLAEDVVQETWARYVGRPPRPSGSLRHWLRTVTRRLASDARRREQSRALRDREAARPEVLPDVAEDLAQGEVLRRVIEAVLALDEPYRSTILERYYRNQDCGEIAARSGIPSATVRSRERRALALLRQRLEREIGKERGSWAAVLLGALVPRTEGVNTPRPKTGWFRRAHWVAAGGTAALLFVATAALQRAPGVSGVTKIEPKAEPTRSVAAVLTSESLGRGRDSASTTEPAPSPAAAPARQAALAEVRGRLVRPGGAPAVGAEIEVDGWGANTERLLRYGEPESWEDPRTTTDDEGRFIVRFDPPRAFQFALRVRFPGHASAAWRWSEFLPGAVEDVGEVELPLGATLEGRIVDLAGREVTGDWWVTAHSIGLRGGFGREETSVHGFVEPGTGRFRLEDVWPGPTELKAQSSMTNSIDGPHVTALAGESIAADIVYSGPDNSRRITVSTSSSPFHVMDSPEEGSLRISGPGIAARKASKIDGSSSAFSFLDLPPAAYTLELDDPRYLPWRKDGVWPGTSVQAQLEGSSALVLDVRDTNDEPLERYEVRVAFRNVNFFPREFRVHDGETPLEGGMLRGIFAGDLTVTVLAEDLGRAAVDVDGLAPNETRSVGLRLEAVGSLALGVGGRVVHPDGTPVANAEVSLVSPAEIDDSPDSPLLSWDGQSSDPRPFRHVREVVVTGADGAFHLQAPDPGPYFLLSTFGPLLSCWSELIEVTPDEPPSDHEIVLPRGGSLQGRIAGPSEADYTGLRAWTCPTGELDRSSRRDPLLRTAVLLRPDGSYELGPVSPGAWDVLLLLPESSGARSVTRSGGRLSGSLPLGTVEVVDEQSVRGDFQVGASFPGRLVLTVLVNGAPAPGLEVSLRRVDGSDPGTSVTVTGPDGSSAPLVAFPGLYRAVVRDREQGWSEACPEEILVASSASSSHTLWITATRGALTCLGSDGQTLVDEPVTVCRLTGSSYSWRLVTTRKTDAEGRLELVLTPGEYSLQRGSYVPGQASPTVPLSWTAGGPRDAHVRF